MDNLTLQQINHSPRFQKERVYWDALLADGSFPAVGFTPDLPPSRGADAAEGIEFILPEELVVRLTTLNKGSPHALFTFLVAALRVLLYRHTGLKEQWLGTSIFQATEESGMINSALPLAARFEADQTVKDLLMQTRELVLGALNHQNFPLANILANQGRTMSSAVFPVFISFDALQHPCYAKGLVSTVAFRFLNRDQALVLKLSHAPEISVELARQIGGQFQAVLAEFAANPRAPLAVVSLMSPVEADQWLAAISSTPTETPVPATVLEMIAREAALHPDRVALVWDSGSDAVGVSNLLSYAELDQQTNRLANWLRARGVGPEVPVILCTERGPFNCIGLWAILKAGGVAVSIDPANPRGRLAMIFDEVRAPVVLTQRALIADLPEHAFCALDDRAWLAASAGPLPHTVGADHAAYMIYTSGSTGRPKGVVIPHGSLTAMLCGYHQYAPLPDPLRGPVVAPHGFDVSILEVFQVIARGGTLHTLSHETIVNASDFAAYLIDRQLTVTYIPPALIAPVVGELERRSDSCALRHVLVGVEPIPRGLLDRLRQRVRGITIINGYGPTEATVVAALGRFEQVGDPNRRASIGKAFPGYQVYPVGPCLQVEPLGALGSLVIGGAGLARCYRDRPDLTAAAFTPDPFAKQPGARLYQTGDLARFLDADHIEFVGRIDHQLKFRGFRVEAGEIEKALLRHEQVSRAVVLVRNDDAGGQQLAAFVVIAGVGDAVGDLRSFLVDLLPPYMIPTVFVELDSLPLTLNGKVDRRALAAMPLPERAGGRGRLPETDDERVLARIWAEVLGLERVYLDDNLFELGGDSILAIQIVARAAQVGLRVKPGDLFQHQTLGAFAAAARRGAAIAAEQGLVSGDVPLTPIQRWYFAEDQPDVHHFNQAILFETRADLQAVVLAEAFRRLIDHHDALRLRFTLMSGQWRQFHDGPVEAVPFHLVDLSRVPEKGRGRVLADAASQLQAGMDLSRGPVLRSALFRYGPREGGRLLIAVHHLVVDGVSWRFLLEDLSALYGQLAAGQSPRLPAKTTSFKEWSARMATRIVPPQSKAFWADRTRAANEIAAYPVDFEHAGNGLNLDAARVDLKIDAALTKALLHDVHGAYNTRITEVLLAALVLAHARSMGLSELMVGLEGHGRVELFEDMDVSRTVGWFTAMYPLVIRLPGRPGLAGALMAVKEEMRAVPNQGIDYGALIYGNDNAEQGPVLAPPISFNYLGQVDSLLTGSEWFPREAAEFAGEAQSPRLKRRFLVEVDALISQGHLEVGWRYSSRHHKRETIAGLADQFKQALSELAAHCKTPGTGAYTPSDFPLARLDQATLNRLTEGVTGKPIADILPLSPMQQGMLYHGLAAPASGVYFEQIGCTIRGALETRAFEAAWCAVSNRHDVCRTAFAWADLAQPLQIVHREVPLAWREEDWRALPPEQWDAQWTRLMKDDRIQGFQPDSPPLMRFVLVRFEDEVHRFLWSSHHLILDGWSFAIIMGEVADAYQVHRNGQSWRPEPVGSFGRYIEWLQRQDMAEAERFWRSALGDGFQPTPVPMAGHALGADTPDVYQEQVLAVPTETATALKALARKNRLTLNTFVQGAWAWLLGHYTLRDDVCFGATVAGRPAELPGVENMAGLFINTLPARIQLAAGDSLTAWLKAVQERQVARERYSYTPLASIQGWCGAGRGGSLFETLVVFENYPIEAAVSAAQGAPVFTDFTHYERTNYPLTLIASARSGMELRFSYDRRRFEGDVVGRMLRHLSRLLTAMVESPYARVGALSPLDASERRTLLNRFTHQPASEPLQSLDHLFKRACDAGPDASALSFNGRLLTYGALSVWALQLAGQLRAAGVGPEAPVALCLPRSLELVAGVLAVVLAGGCYVPIDPAYPAERLAYTLEDCGARVMLAFDAGDPPPVKAETTLYIKEPAKMSKLLVLEPVGLDPANLLYVIYTSGSTGRPKGVQITHGHVHRLFSATRDWFNFDRSDVWTLFHSYAFDFSVWELWGALLHGGRLVVPDHQATRSPARFHGLLRAERVTVLNQTPSAFYYLIELDGEVSDPLRDLRYVIFGGEALDARRLEPWFARYGDQRPELVNMYGITETTVHVTYRVLREADAVSAQSGIGEPIPDLRVYILDHHGRLLPEGAAGELHVGGAGPARGYLNRPALTATRFVPDEFSGEAGGRLYRSGDLAAHPPNRDMTYRGRIDNQVKIRGFRIELGEIEAVLAGHPRVKAAAASIRTDDRGDTRLLAHLAVTEKPTVAELRVYLAERLPEHMVPAVYVLMDALPLTSNGKIDRRALPEPDAGRLALETPLVTPVTRGEEILCAIWAEVLGVDQVGVEDNYFELGGDSILSLRIVAAAKREGLGIDLTQFFKHQTVRDIVRAAGPIEVASEPTGEPEPFALIEPVDKARLPDDVEDAYPPATLQAGMLFHASYNPEQAMYHDVFTHRARAPYRENALRETLQWLAARHPMLRTSFALGGYRQALQLVHRKVTIPLTLEDLRGSDAVVADALESAWMARDKALGFDWRSAPLIRFHVIVYEDDFFCLCMSCHHAVLDGWSVASLMTEFFQVYMASAMGQPLPAAPNPPAYASFVDLERRALASEESRRFWLDGLAGADFDGLPGLPACFRDKGNAAPLVSLSLNDAVTSGLKALAKSLGVPLKSVLLTAHLKVLSGLRGRRDVISGLVTNGRGESPGAERTLGLFLNTLPFRLDLKPDSWRGLVRRVFELERDLLPHRRFPLAELQKALGGRALFDVAFNFTHFHVYQGLVGLDGLEIVAGDSYERTNFTLMAEFGLDVVSNGISLALKYDPEHLNRARVSAALGSYASVLECMAESPEAWHHVRDYLPPKLRRQMLVTWNNNRTAFVEPRRVEQLIAAMAEQQPDEIALIFDDPRSAPGSEPRLTYHQMNQWANRVANWLRSHGAGPEKPVAVCMDRCLEMVVALLGVWKAGGAYLPIEPSLPLERQGFMLADARVGVMITQAAFRERFSMIAMEKLYFAEDAVDDQLGFPLETWGGPENLAYVIYTSGSTGMPKGVMNTHFNVTNRLLWGRRAYPLEPGDRVMFKTPFHFDVSVWELFGPLVGGACMVIAKPEGHRDSAYLSDLIARRRVTAAHFIPSMLRAVLEEKRFEDCRQLSRVFCSGEVLPFDLCRRFFQTISADLYNLYGPTEGTVEITGWQCRELNLLGEIPIGGPFGNNAAYILDDDLHPLPVGVPGELCFVGDNIARGYLRRPEKTASQFVPNPFADKSLAGSRLYRTGDLCRYLPNGDISFLGRRDQQVKLHGFRIELGEIESALSSFPMVREAAVVCSEDKRGARLIAFYIPLDRGVSVEDLKSHLSRNLPDYMIPSLFVARDDFPRTSGGKLDRASLWETAARTTLGQETARSRTPARSPEEHILVDIWRELLGVPDLGVHDNFFELGGDSILSLQAAARANQAGLRFTVKQLAEHRTIAELAAVLERAPMVRTDAGPVTGEAPLTPIQHWFFEQALAEWHHYNQAVMLTTPADLSVPCLIEALNLLLDWHDALRLRFRMVDGRPRQEYGPVGETASLLVCDGFLHEGSVIGAQGLDQVDRVQAGLDPSNGPLLRAALFPGNARENVRGRLLLVIHHLAVDGVSWRILLEDLTLAYRALSSGKAPQPPAKTSSYRDWSRALESHARDQAIDGERSFWLDPARKMATPLPGEDVSQDGNLVGSVGQVSASLAVDHTRALLYEAPLAYQTEINDFLLTALASAVREWTNDPHVLIALEGHGREDLFPHLDVSRTVGWFTTIYPVLLHLPEGGLDTVLKSVKDQLRAIPARGVGYGLLRYKCGDEALKRDLAALPQPMISFNYLGQVDSTLSDGGLFQFSEASTGHSYSPAGGRPFLIEVTAVISGRRLNVSLAYSKNIHNEEDMIGLARTFTRNLEGLIKHCTHPRSGGYTPTDFPLAGRDQTGLDFVIKTLVNRCNLSGHRDVVGLYPLTASQQGMLFESLAAPESGIHIEQSRWLLEGSLDSLVFKRAWVRVAEAFAVLRTGFFWSDAGEPLQYVRRKITLPLEKHDWIAWPSEKVELELDRLLKADRRRGFDPAYAPLWRLNLIRETAVRHRLVWTYHHMLMDGWSVALVLNRVFEVYRELERGRDLTDPLVHPYSDYMAWLGGRDHAGGETYWRDYLSGFSQPTPPGVVSGRPKDSAKSMASVSRVHEVAFAASGYQTLLAWIRPRGISLNSVVQAVWALLLGHYGDTRDVVFGATVSGRPPEVAGIENMVGLFINTVPVRVRIQPDMGLEKLLLQLQRDQVERASHAFFAGGEIHRLSGFGGGTALFESLLVFENYPVKPGGGNDGDEGLMLHEEQAVGAQTHHPLTLLLLPEDDRLVCRFIYQTDCFEQDDIARLASDFTWLLPEVSRWTDQDPLTLCRLLPQEGVPLFHRREPAVAVEKMTPSGETETRLSAIWREVLSRDDIGVRDNFFELGGHSLLAVRLMGRIREVFDKDLPLAVLFETATIEAFARHLDSLRTDEKWSPLVTMRQGGAKPPLYIVHPAGGNLLCYMDLVNALAPGRPIYGLQAFGLREGQQPLASVASMAAVYVAAIEEQHHRAPMQIAGWSFGGLIALEMARLIKQRHGLEPKLVVIDAIPHTLLPEYHQKLDDWQIFAKALEPDIILGDMPVGMPRKQRLDHVIELAKERHVIPPEMGRSQVKHLMTYLKTNYRIRHNPDPYEGEIVLFHVADHKHVPADVFVARWAYLAAGGLKRSLLEGTHESIMLNPNVQILAEILDGYLT